MSKTKLWTVVALAAAMVTLVSDRAEAFCCHKYRSIPVWFGVYYPNCGPCGGCIAPYVASGCYSGYGYCGMGCGYGSCGYGSCGYGGCYGGVGYKKHHLGAHRAWKHWLRGCGNCFYGCGGCDGYSVGCGDCGGCGSGCDSCGGGCGDGGCVDGGCGDGSVGCSNCGVDGGSHEEVIYDGPAAGAPPAEAAPVPQDTSAGIRRPLITLAGMRTGEGDGSAQFADGISAYRNGSLDEAARDFDAASTAEPNNALYHYHRALALHDLYGAESAQEALDQAIQAEQREPVKNWGKRMERVQGRTRLWIEKARREAGLVR